MLDLADELKTKQQEREPHRLLEGPHARPALPQALDADAGLARGRGCAISARRRSTSRTTSSSSHAASRSRTRPACSPATSTRSRSAPTSHARWRCSAAAAVPDRQRAHRRSASAPGARRPADDAGAVRRARGTFVSPGSATATTSASRSPRRARCSGAELSAPSRRATSPTTRRSRSPHPREAVRGAHVVVTDVWTSMGQEAERGERLRPSTARRSTRRCSRDGRSGGDRAPLPAGASRARRSARTSSTARQSAVWDEAENRLHTAKALLALIV